MPHKHKPVATAEQLCDALHSIAAASSATARAGAPLLPDSLASISSITPSSISWICSSPEMQPVAQRILAMAEQCKQRSDVQPSPAVVDEPDMRSAQTTIFVYITLNSACHAVGDDTVTLTDLLGSLLLSEELSSLSSLCHTADLRLCSLHSSLSHLTAASHTLQQQLNQTQHNIQQHNLTLANAEQQLATLQQQYDHTATAHTTTLHTLTTSLASLPNAQLLSSLIEADDAVDAAVSQWEAAADAVWDERASSEVGVEEVERELQRLSAALEVQYRQTVHAELQRLAAKHRYEAAVQQKEQGPAVQLARDSEEHQSAAAPTHTAVVVAHHRWSPSSHLERCVTVVCSVVRWWMPEWSWRRCSAG